MREQNKKTDEQNWIICFPQRYRSSWRGWNTSHESFGPSSVKAQESDIMLDLWYLFVKKKRNIELKKKNKKLQITIDWFALVTVLHENY